MPAPPVYLDECVHRSLVRALRKRGFLVTCAADEGMANRGVPDAGQLDYATAHGWLLVTYAIRDFYQVHLAFHQQGHAGIVAVPDTLPRQRIEIRIALLLDWLADTDTRTQFYARGQLQELIEQGYRLPGYSDWDLRLALGR